MAQMQPFTVTTVPSCPAQDQRPPFSQSAQPLNVIASDTYPIESDAHSSVDSDTDTPRDTSVLPSPPASDIVSSHLQDDLVVIRAVCEPCAAYAVDHPEVCSTQPFFQLNTDLCN